MTDRELKLVIGSLLHDVGKVIYREGSDVRRHSQSGYTFLKEEVGITDKEILNSVRYHHSDEIKHAEIVNDDLAYITYIADNIAAALDRRTKDTSDTGFEIASPLQSVFNILNGNNGKCYYCPEMLNIQGEINYPGEQKKPYSRDFYYRVKTNLYDNLKGIDLKDSYLNSLLAVLEANLAYVPSSTAKHEIADISLFDHSKVTAAIASCIYQYLKAEGTTDYKECLYKKASDFYTKDAFLLASIDLSGIQSFIYTIASAGALKALRTRSFYLEIMMEHIVDQLLDRVNLSRANLVLNGGGHCYFLLPNTERTKEAFDAYCEEVNSWLLEQFDADLFAAGVYTQCSAQDLKNTPNGSYSEIYKRISRKLGEKKAKRYNAKQIRILNHRMPESYARECAICKRIGKVNEKNQCDICERIERFSGKILEDNLFVVVSSEQREGLPLPGNEYLLAESKVQLKKRMDSDPYYVRCYGKNEQHTGSDLATNLWVGTYSSSSRFDELTKKSIGIERLGVLRADVDNLGTAIQRGFSGEYNSLSRGASLSRQLSLFFKAHINQLLASPRYFIGEKKEARDISIVYSGGDDLFLVGAWNDMIEFSVELTENFKRFTQGVLTLSAGVELYSNGYPISAMARETAELEDASKSIPGKNAITVMQDGMYHDVQDNGEIYEISDGTYHWDEFRDEVIAEKYSLIHTFFENSEERGKAFMYHLLELIRQHENGRKKIQFARFIYLLSRMAPADDAEEQAKQLYSRFADSMYRWVQNEKDRRQLKTAMNLYAYMVREREVEDEDH